MGAILLLVLYAKSRDSGPAKAYYTQEYNLVHTGVLQYTAGVAVVSWCPL
jgi:hypothetical protein